MSMTYAVSSALTDEEAYLYAILQDHSGLDLAEFSWFDGSSEDGCFRAWPFQWDWWRNRSPKQIDQCVAAGQLVMTDRGHVAIEDITVGTRVLTHEGRWRHVTAVFDHGLRPVVSVKGQGHPGLVVTPDHRIFARRSRRASKPRDGHTGKKLLEPEWLSPQNWEWNDGSGRMHANWGTPARIEATEIPPPMEPAYRSGQQNLVTDTWTETWMWLYGLYIAEGSSYIDGPGKGLVHRVRWSLHPDEVDEVTVHLEKVGLNWSSAPSGTAVNVSVNSRPVTEWLSQWAGRLAPNKHLATWVFGLPEHLRRAVFDGLVFGDAHWRRGTWSYSTVSKALAIEIRLLGLSLGESVSLSKPKHHPTQTIEGRTVNCHQKYVISFNPLRNQTKPHMQVVDGAAWAPVTSVAEAGVERVYDLEVEGDHSFLVEGIAVHNCGRAVGKSLSIKARMFVFPFRHPGQEAVITAPELIHLEPIINLIEDQFYSTRLGREMLQKGRSAVTHRPFMMNFRNSARLMGRIPQKDGKGVKGIHPLQLELDEAQDYPRRGWTELNATLKSGFDGSEWRAHGVTRGVRDKFYEYTQDKPGNSWKVHRMTAMHRPNWTDQEREDSIQLYGGHRDDPDYRRNILGKHGDATNPLFVVTRLYSCHPGDTLVAACDEGGYALRRIDMLETGDEVCNAVGTGTVTRTLQSEHSVLVRLVVDGEALYVTPEHPYFTDRGWIAAGQLEPGDRLVDMSGVRDLWRTGIGPQEAMVQCGMRSEAAERPSLPQMRNDSDDRAEALLLQEVLPGRPMGGNARAAGGRTLLRGLRRNVDQEGPETVLLPQVLGQVGHCPEQTVSGVSEARLGVESEDVLQPGMRQRFETPAEREAGGVLSVLREGHSLREGRQALLLSGMLECLPSASTPENHVRGVRRRVHHGSPTAFLLAELCREVRWEEIGGTRIADNEDLSAVRNGVLPGGQDSQVLLTALRAQGDGGAATFARPAVQALWSGVSPDEGHARLLLDGVLGDGEKADEASEAGDAPKKGGSWRTPCGPVPTVAGFRRHRDGMATPTLDEPAGQPGRRGHLLADRPSARGEEDCCRGGRHQSSTSEAGGEGRRPGRLASFPRVDSVEVLQSGSPAFRRLSGGKDTVTCYDLTVSGHPSFFVGERGVLVHNCVDDDESSNYNSHEYVHLEISDLMVEDLGPDGDVTDLLLFPDSHRDYETTWCGMDVGYTHDPSEILVWGEYHPDVEERKAMGNRKKACPKVGLSRFKLLARISLKRVPNLKQVRLILGIIAFYRPKAFGLDKTGVGLPLFQDLLAIIREEGDFSAQAQAAADIIKGYNFSAKVIVDIDDTVEVDEVDGDQVRDAGIHRNVLEQSTDALRGYVDSERLWLPWDDQLLAEFEGQTFSYSKSAIDQFGRARRVFSQGRFHALDAARMFAMAHSQQAIEAIVGAKDEKEAVIARFFQPGL